MNALQILHTAFSFLPFVVCLFWTICFAVRLRKADKAKRYFMAYIATCVVLYLSHGLFFTVGISYEWECLWTLCSLSVYPLFYGYLCRLTSSEYDARQLLPWLMPGLLVAVAKYALPDAGIDRLRLILFIVQIVTVVYFGIRRLKAFDRQLQTVYADTEERDTSAVHHLLIAIIVVSLLSGIANSAGKQFFGESLGLLAFISLAFSAMQFALSYISFFRSFTVDQLIKDENDGDDESKGLGNDLVEKVDGHVEKEKYQEEKQHKDGPEEEDLGKMFEKLMVEDLFFLKHDLKIGDVVKALGSNRTYVSNYINTTYNCSFSDYMNRLRVEYAERLLASSPHGTKLSQIAQESGFASEASFYRNFKKFAGVTPSDWQHQTHGASAKE